VPLGAERARGSYGCLKNKKKSRLKHKAFRNYRSGRPNENKIGKFSLNIDLQSINSGACSEGGMVGHGFMAF